MAFSNMIILIEYQNFIMQLSLPPQNKTQAKIKQIQEEKKRLKDRIEKIKETQSKTQADQVITYEDNMATLMEKKKKLQEQRQRQSKMKRMQEEYFQRRKQIQRQKRLQQLQNEKRMIELQVGIKRMVFEGTKEKVKGMNSEQLMMRALLRQGRQQPKQKPYSSKGNVRRDFEAFLEAEHKSELKQKWDVYQLNEKRFQIFEKKQQAVMRQILLKQLISKGLDEDINVLKMSKSELEEKLQEFGIEIADYVQSIPKQAIISAWPDIEKQAKERINYENSQKNNEIVQAKNIEKEKAKLRQFLLKKPADMVQISRSIVIDIINSLVFDYEKRLNRFKTNQFDEAKKDLQQKYEKILLQNDNYEYSKIITLRILQKIHEEFLQEAAQQVAKLHNFAHTKTQQCFSWMFGKDTNIVKKLQDIAQVDIPLNFEDDVGEKRDSINKNNLKKDDYLKKFEDFQTNVFDVDKLTTELINQINLLEVQSKYFKNISTKIYGEKEGPQGAFHILFDRQFYAITNEAVYNAKKIKVKLQKLGINSKLQILNWLKFHHFWLIHDTEKVSLYSPWGLQVLGNEIGERIANACGKITSVEIFPIYTLLGQTCSVMLGFEKGHILKYNMNLNRIDNTQTNLSFYSPVLPQIKKQEEPPFPLQKKNIIKIESRKITQKVEIHQFRQFFDHHTSAIVGINFYKHNSFITVDKSMKCAIWYYDYKQGGKCYSPAYTFQFVPSSFVYRESENSKFQNIYPGEKIKQSPQQMYQKWLQTEGFLRKQIYNNPKKQTAYYRSTQDKEQKGQVSIWTLTYDDSKVIKIHQSSYYALPGKMQAKSTKLWRDYLMILCQREHSIRQDLKTIKVYGWNIEQRKMRSIGIQFDVYKNQTQVQFQFLDTMLAGVNLELMAIVSSGRILIFSLISGQLLRNISDAQFLQQPKYANYYFTEITTKKSILGAATKINIMEISLNDHNSHQQQKELNTLLEEVTRKYINLI